VQTGWVLHGHRKGFVLRTLRQQGVFSCEVCGGKRVYEDLQHGVQEQEGKMSAKKKMSPMEMENIKQILNDVSWEEVKMFGFSHYKTGGAELIDIYRGARVARSKALTDIMKYAYRNLEINRPEVNRYDIHKIIHYALIVMALMNEGEA